MSFVLSLSQFHMWRKFVSLTVSRTLKMLCSLRPVEHVQALRAQDTAAHGRYILTLYSFAKLC